MSGVRTTNIFRRTLELVASVIGQARGQSVAEFAIVLPVVLTLVLGGIDFSRMYERQMRLEAASREASETVATVATTTTEAYELAREIVCRQFERAPDCTLATIPPEGTCSDLCLDVTFSTSTTALGATAESPMATAQVTAAAPFRTLFPYPFLTPDTGELTLGSHSQYAVLQGR
jgi:Flp pilus assembly protein TadG